MNKHKVLERKLKRISNHIDKMTINDEATMKYLTHYKDYVEQLIYAVQKKTISNSEGAALGLTRGISDYDEICSDSVLWNLVIDADNYYSYECKSF